MHLWLNMSLYDKAEDVLVINANFILDELNNFKVTDK